MKHAALIARLCEASEGSAELSAEVHTALTGTQHSVYELGDGSRLVVTGTNGYTRPCLTTSLSAAWEEAERRGHSVLCTTHWHGEGRRSYTVLLGLGKATGRDKSCALCAAILAAEGER